MIRALGITRIIKANGFSISKRLKPFGVLEGYNCQLKEYFQQEYVVEVHWKYSHLDYKTIEEEKTELLKLIPIIERAGYSANYLRYNKVSSIEQLLIVREKQ